ncbi:MAG: GntR family transcriptional regulator [Rubrivivax sp.]
MPTPVALRRAAAAADTAWPRRPRSLAHELVESLGDRIRDGRLAAGEKLPTEAEIMAAHGVSRTVVREALSKLQAAGQVRTRHGIGTFVVGPGEAAPFRIAPAQLATLDDVIALLELRIGVETEAAALAAQRRSDTNLRQAARGARRLPARRRGRPRRGGGRLPLPLGIARATRNAHFAGLMAALGETAIPRAARCAGAADRRAARVPEASTPSTTTSSTPSRAATGRGARGDAHAPGQQPRTPPPRPRPEGGTGGRA